MGFDFFGGPWFDQGTDQEETPEERRRRQEQEALQEAPAETPDVQELLTPPSPKPEDDVMSRIPPAEGGPTTEILNQYRQWLAERPSRTQYEAGTGRKILAGLVGFLGGLRGGPETAMKLTRSIVDDPYNEAVEDWQGRGKSLGDVGKLAQDISETQRKRSGDIMDFMSADERVKAAREAIKQRADAEDQRHNDRITSAKTEAERAAEVKRHNQEMEGIASTRNRIDQMDAEAHKTTAEAYKSRVGALNTGAGTEKKIGSYSDMTEALNDSLQEMEAQYPDLEKYFDIKDNPATGMKTYVPKTGLAPVDQQRMEAMLADAQKRARKKLEGVWGLGDVEDVPGLKPEVP
jgi:hypothetical protein